MRTSASRHASDAEREPQQLGADSKPDALRRRRIDVEPYAAVYHPHADDPAGVEEPRGVADGENWKGRRLPEKRVRTSAFRRWQEEDLTAVDVLFSIDPLDGERTAVQRLAGHQFIQFGT